MTMPEKEGKFLIDDEYKPSDIFINSDDFPNGAIIAQQPLASSVVFHFNQPEPILVLNKDGFHFKGETIEDAGEAYEAFMEVMGKVKNDNAI